MGCAPSYHTDNRKTDFCKFQKCHAARSKVAVKCGHGVRPVMGGDRGQAAPAPMRFGV